MWCDVTFWCPFQGEPTCHGASQLFCLPCFNRCQSPIGGTFLCPIWASGPSKPGCFAFVEDLRNSGPWSEVQYLCLPRLAHEVKTDPASMQTIDIFDSLVQFQELQGPELSQDTPVTSDPTSIEVLNGFVPLSADKAPPGRCPEIVECSLPQLMALMAKYTIAIPLVSIVTRGGATSKRQNLQIVGHVDGFH